MPLIPDDPAILATAVADSVVVATDRAGRHASLPYWERAQPWVGDVVKAIQDIDVSAVTVAAGELQSDVRSYQKYDHLRTVLTEAAGRYDKASDLLRLGWRAQINTRFGYYIGKDYVPSPPTTTIAGLQQTGLANGADEDTNKPADPVALIVIPFRDVSVSRSRLRNLLSCLIALRDQSLDKDKYCVTVVETDETPRWSEVIKKYCDHYIFAPSSSLFNRAWAVNVGVRNTPGNWNLICILDADVLADRDFIRRNTERFLQPGASMVLPYRNMFCLDASATDTAVRQRIEKGMADPSEEVLRGFLVRRPPGCCGWIRRESFDRVAGMDERYEGWGGEDTDFAFRANLDGGLDRYADRLLHLDHDPSDEIANGDVKNLHIAPLSWPKNQVIGDVDKYAAI